MKRGLEMKDLRVQRGLERKAVPHTCPLLLAPPSRGADSRLQLKILNGSQEAKGITKNGSSSTRAP